MARILYDNGLYNLYDFIGTICPYRWVLVTARFADKAGICVRSRKPSLSSPVRGGRLVFLRSRNPALPLPSLSGSTATDPDTRPDQPPDVIDDPPPSPKARKIYGTSRVALTTRGQISSRHRARSGCLGIGRLGDR
jgi:hypothetical protein